MDKEEILDVLERWEGTGLLSGLPPWEKEELAILYDNVTRVMLYKSDRLEEPIVETLSDVSLPVTRRLYRRVGINFDINNMMDVLVEKVKENYNEINQKPSKDGKLNPVVDFCVEFSDTYSDKETLRNVFTKEEYDLRVDKITSVMKEILSSEEMVSFVDRSDDDWVIKYSETKKSSNQVRIWNQKRAIETLHGLLNETNQGV